MNGIVSHNHVVIPKALSFLWLFKGLPHAKTSGHNGVMGPQRSQVGNQDPRNGKGQSLTPAQHSTPDLGRGPGWPGE